ncbi:MAG: PAS domain S-box protein [Hydrogenophaga sp.]|nr:PAS domain S-box protein [Hydrogenophaga sp.]
MNAIFALPTPQDLALQAEFRAVHAALEGIITVDAAMRIVMINPAAQRMFGLTASEALGRNLSMLLPARLRSIHAAHMRQFSLSNLIERPMGQRGQLVGVRANGEEFPLEAAICKVDLAHTGGLQHHYTALLRDLSEEHKLTAVIEQLNQRIRALFDRAPVAIWITDGEQVVFANHACARLLDVNSRDDLIGRSIYDLLSPEAHPGLRHKVAQALVSEREATTLHGEIVRHDGRLREVEIVVAPLPDQERTFVQMVITDVTARLQEKRALLHSRRTLRELSASLVAAREEERRRIARELHDELGQRLTALKLELAAQQQDGRTGELAERTQAMMDMVDETVSAVRRIAMDLRPPMLDDLGLSAAIEWLTHDFERRSGIKITLRLVTRPESIPQNIATAVYRIVQEALTNMARHAHASQAVLSIETRARYLLLTVEDDGQGFPKDPAPPPRGSFGLIGIRERVHMLGGQFTLKNAPSGGARLVVRLPLLAACRLDPVPQPGEHEPSVLDDLDDLDAGPHALWS